MQPVKAGPGPFMGGSVGKKKKLDSLGRLKQDQHGVTMQRFVVFGALPLFPLCLPDLLAALLHRTQLSYSELASFAGPNAAPAHTTSKGLPSF